MTGRLNHSSIYCQGRTRPRLGFIGLSSYLSR